MKSIFTTEKKKKILQVSQMPIFLIALFIFTSMQVFAQPTISIRGMDPSSARIPQGTSKNVTVIATVMPTNTPLSYQWYSNSTNSNSGGTEIAGATTQSYTVPATLALGTYYYYCVVSAAGAQSQTSPVVTITVALIPVITIVTPPVESLTVTEGNITETLSIEATVTENATLSYQWLNSQGTDIAGATNRVFNIPATLTPGRYSYSCKVSASGGASSLWSSACAVTVQASAVIPQITINNTLPLTTYVTEGNISGSFSISASVTQGATLNYQWYSNVTASAVNGSPTLIPGETNTVFNIPVNLTPGGEYYYFCTVSAENAVSKNSSVARVIVEKNNTEPVITILYISPMELTVTEGNISGGFSITTDVTQDATLEYQWYSNSTKSNSDGVEIPGATEQTYTVPTTLTEGTYYYYCVVSADGAESKTSSVATLTVNAVSTDVVITLNSSTPTNVTVSEGNITGGLSVTASVQPTTAQLFFQWYSNSTATSTGGTPVSNATSSYFSIPATLTAAGSPYYYYCIVSAENAEPKTSRVATVTVLPVGTEIPVITITSQPATNTTVTEGNITGSLSIEAEVTLNATLTYQWYGNTIAANSNGTAIQDATGSTFNIPAQLTEGTYYYYCVVSASDGAIPETSDIATVTVNKSNAVPVIARSGMTVYPNPVTSELYIRLDTQESADYILYNSTGQIIMSGKVQNETTIHVESLSKGIYYLRVKEMAVKVIK